MPTKPPSFRTCRSTTPCSCQRRGKTSSTPNEQENASRHALSTMHRPSSEKPRESQHSAEPRVRLALRTRHHDPHAFRRTRLGLALRAMRNILPQQPQPRQHTPPQQRPDNHNTPPLSPSSAPFLTTPPPRINSTASNNSPRVRRTRLGLALRARPNRLVTIIIYYSFDDFGGF